MKITKSAESTSGDAVSYEARTVNQDEIGGPTTEVWSPAIERRSGRNWNHGGSGLAAARGAPPGRLRDARRFCGFGAIGTAGKGTVAGRPSASAAKGTTKGI